MTSRILFLVLVVSIFSSCSSAYKTTRTPDDVYYSPGKETTGGEYVDYVGSNDDRYLRMKVRNNNLWSTIDDYDYWNDSRYDFGYSCAPSRIALMNCFNPYYAYMYNPFYTYRFYYTPWGSWYNPHYTIVYFNQPKVYYGTTSKTNLAAYANRNYKNYNLPQPQTSKNSFGSLLHRVVAPNNNNYINPNNNNSRTFNSNTTPSNNTGGRSGGFKSSGSSSGTSRPPRPPH